MLLNEKKKQLPVNILTTSDMAEAIEQYYPTEFEDAEINEPICLDFKEGTNKKGDQFVAVFSSIALLQNAIQQPKVLGRYFQQETRHINLSKEKNF